MPAEEMNFGNYSRHINALVVADAAATVVGGLEVWEALLGDYAFADGPIGVAVEVWKNIITGADTAAVTAKLREADGGRQVNGRTEGEEGSKKVHFVGSKQQNP
ncbi:hypothetical protein TWF718_007913 [Orbilia javanica]|uniref:Uncharacterized protein n=1 Tax=Orbilia javanica TaxID=47235 RepID=A0AAN8N086_9PEZI